MNGATYNPDDLLFLADRALDETLSDSDRRILDEALRSSPDLRRNANELCAVSKLVERWRQAPVELDWEHFAALATDRAAIDEASLEPADRLLRRWGEAVPGYDAEALQQRVLSDVLQAPILQRRPIGRGWLFRFSAPLAAAAAIGFVLTARPWFGASNVPVCRVAMGPSVTMPVISDDSGELPRAIVSFSRSAPSGAISQHAEVAPAFGGVSSSRAVEPVAFP